MMIEKWYAHIFFYDYENQSEVLSEIHRLAIDPMCLGCYTDDDGFHASARTPESHPALWSLGERLKEEGLINDFKHDKGGLPSFSESKATLYNWVIGTRMAGVVYREIEGRLMPGDATDILHMFFTGLGMGRSLTIQIAHSLYETEEYRLHLIENVQKHKAFLKEKGLSDEEIKKEMEKLKE
jgi:hypothetical protein